MKTELPFPDVQKDDWLKKVAEDLKGTKSWEDFIRNVEGLNLDPFILPDEPHKALLPLDRLFDQVETGVSLTVSQAQKGNSIVKTYLEQGASALYLNVVNDLEPEVLFEGIHLEFILVILEIENKILAKKFVKYLDKNYVDKSVQTFIYCGSETIYPGFTYVLKGNINNDYILPFTNILNEFEKRIQSKKPFRCVLTFSIGKDFLMTIAALRAFRILWENLVSYLGFEGDIALILCASPNYEVLSEDPNQTLIEMSYLTLCGLLGNVDVFFGNQSGKNQSIREGLKVLHLQHIFLNEGKLAAVKDPVSGSFYIEQATQKIAEEVWAKYLKY